MARLLPRIISLLPQLQSPFLERFLTLHDYFLLPIKQLVLLLESLLSLLRPCRLEVLQFVLVLLLLLRHLL
jgi:hypothetical protein